MFRQYRHKQAAATSFDWMLYTMLEKHYTNAKDKRVQFQINYGFDSYYKIYDVNYLLTHGDRLELKVVVE